MESTARARFVRSTPTKARLVANAVKGKPVGDALSMLELNISKSVAVDVAKTIKSAVANMQSKNAEAAIDIDGLLVKEIRVDQGPQLKRFRARAQGRVGRIVKKMCHISVTLSD
ncbi:MAG: 50S ribosomal protein L22 [Chitinivibrionales bacterium]|nr:50S ribosomal protein L22 [Chitinivibrionales bacterium]